MLRLVTFGGARIERDGEALGGAAGQRRVVALLSMLAVARDRGISRDRVLAVLWAESEPEKARQALTQALYHARRAVQADDLFVAAADLRLNPSVMISDVGEFESALDRGDLASAVDLYTGAFLDGFYVNGAPEFERWTAEERARLASRCAGALEQLADADVAASNHAAAVEWLRRLASIDPLNSRVALKLMTAMATAGDRAGAIRHARVHETLLRDELGVDADPTIVAFANRLREGFPEQPRVARAIADIADSVAPAVSVEPVIRADGRATPGAAAPTQSLRTPPRRRAMIVVAVLAVVAIGAIASILLARRGADEPTTQDIVVVPFRVAGADPALAFLHEGLVDLLFTKLTDDKTIRASDPGAVMAAWRRARLTGRIDVAHAEVYRIARQLGGERVLLGSVVGTPERLVINASLFGVRDGSLRAQASVEGKADSLTGLVDRLVARLLAEEANERGRLSGSMSTSAQAVRAYLDGQAAYRGGGYRDAIRHFRHALDRDPTFALAGLGMAHAADRINARDDQARGIAAAWASRSELTDRDSGQLAALAGPRYPAPSSEREYLIAWERAAAVLSDRADVWHELGERLFHDGRLLGVAEWETRSLAAFRRAAELDPTFASPLRYIVQVAAFLGDTAEVTRAATAYTQLDSVGDLAAFVGWRAAVALGDTARLRELRRSFGVARAASLRAINLSAQYDGVELGDAERAHTYLRSRAVRGDERNELLLAQHALALNRGDLRRALQALDDLDDAQPLSRAAARFRILDALFDAGDSKSAARSALRISERLAPAGSAAGGATRASTPDPDDECVLALWNVWPWPAATSARGAEPRPPAPKRLLSSPMCIALSDAVEAVGRRHAEARAAVTRFDSVLTFGPPMGALRDYAGLVLARLYAELGDQRRALAAANRRAHMQEWPHYLAPQLRETARLSAAVGDTAGALRAYRHYLALRSEADPPLATEVEALRAELRRLEASAPEER